MSNTPHTKTPWQVRTLERNGETVDAFVSSTHKADGMPYELEIMGDDYNGYGDEQARIADARRIVACVNACAGLSTEFLENAHAKYEQGIKDTFAAFENEEKRMQSEITVLRAKLGEAERDAERYRALRDSGKFVPCMFGHLWASGAGNNRASAHDLDAAIDAAMGA